LQTLFTFFYKRSYSFEEVKGTKLSPSVSVPCIYSHTIFRRKEKLSDARNKRVTCVKMYFFVIVRSQSIDRTL